MKISELLIGTKIREKKSGLVFLVADHNHIGFPGTTITTDKVILNACFDAAEDNNPQQEIAEGGNNFYPHSNIHQWLNSDKKDWYQPQHEYDEAPDAEHVDSVGWEALNDTPLTAPDTDLRGDYSYVKEAGFLSWFSKEFVDSIEESEVSCYLEPDPTIVRFASPLPYHLKCKVFLPSALELGEPQYNCGTEGHRVRLFADPRMRVCAPTGYAIHRPGLEYMDSLFFYLTRTPKKGTKNRIITFNGRSGPGDYANGNCGSTFANMSSGVRPLLNMKNDTPVSDYPDEQNIYEFLL